MSTSIDRTRFQAVAITALAAVIFVGFAKTYYMKYLFDTPPLTRAAHMHGIVATVWLVLHYTQSRLVHARRIDIHRRLGIGACVVAVVLTIQAALLGIHGAASGQAPPGRDPLQFLSFSLGTTATFAIFVASAVSLRRAPEWHKRLMFLATLTLVIPATGRLDSQIMQPLGLPRVVLGFLITAGFIVWACINDWRRSGRIHPAYWIGGTFLFLSLLARRWLGTTDAWQPIARWLVGVFA